MTNTLYKSIIQGQEQHPAPKELDFEHYLFMNITLAVILGFIAYRRWRVNPLPERSK